MTWWFRWDEETMEYTIELTGQNSNPFKWIRAPELPA